MKDTCVSPCLLISSRHSTSHHHFLFTEVTVKLPPDIKSSKELKVTINAADICVARRDGSIIIKDTLPYKIRSLDSFWSFSEGKLLIHLGNLPFL